MKAIQILFAFFLIVPFIEITVLMQVGSIIGVFPTIFMVVFTAVLGAQIPTYEMIEGPILLVGGALLLTPGFFTDILGFACLIPSLRRKIAQYVIENHLLVAQTGEIFKQRSSFSNGAIEGEFKKED